MATPVESAAELREDARRALRDLLLTLADSKRMLGIRYSDWMLGAPTLEAGIAASSMAQDEWGHGRLTYALLSDFGDQPKELEHEREASAYHSISALDRPLRSWSELIATALLVDTALAIQFEALLDARYGPAHNRVQKLLDEEAFHYQYAAGWTRQMAANESVREELRSALAALLPEVLRWFGRDEAAAPLLEEGLVRGGPQDLRQRFLACVGPVLQDAGVASELGLAGETGAWKWAGELEWDDWKDASRRGPGEGPDPETISRVRGDKNRALLMD